MGREEAIEEISSSLDSNRIPFVLADTHLQFAKGSPNGHTGLDFLVDSGLAASMPLIVMDETVEEFGVKKIRFLTHPIIGFRSSRMGLVRSSGERPRRWEMLLSRSNPTGTWGSNGFRHHDLLSPFRVTQAIAGTRKRSQCTPPSAPKLPFSALERLIP